MKKYSLLLSGGVDNHANRICYHNDLAFAYEVLHGKMGYQKEDIFVLYSDGRNLKYKNTVIQSKRASKQNIIKILTDTNFKQDDSLFILVSNHGSNQENGSICLWGEGEYIQLKEIVDMLNKVCCKKIIVLGQCFGGNILKYELENSCVITANEAGMETFTQLFRKGEQPSYDEFLYHFISYFNGSYPNGLPLSTKIVENNIFLAYQYAWENDIFNCKSKKYDNRMSQITSASEIPQFKNTMVQSGVISI